MCTGCSSRFSLLARPLLHGLGHALAKLCSWEKLCTQNFPSPKVEVVSASTGHSLSIVVFMHRHAHIHDVTHTHTHTWTLSCLHAHTYTPAPCCLTHTHTHTHTCFPMLHHTHTYMLHDSHTHTEKTHMYIYTHVIAFLLPHAAYAGHSVNSGPGARDAKVCAPITCQPGSFPACNN